MSSGKSKLALLDDSNFPIELIEVGQNIRRRLGKGRRNKRACRIP